MTWFSTRRNASVGKSPLSGMPPANEITAGFDAAVLTSVRARSSSAAMICALRERSPDQLRVVGAVVARPVGPEWSCDATGRSTPAASLTESAGGPSEAPDGPRRSATNVPWPTWARAQPAATNSSYASATVPRFTPSVCASSRVAGSFIPGTSSRSRMSRSRCAWIWRASGIGLSRSSAMFTVVTYQAIFTMNTTPSRANWPDPHRANTRPLIYLTNPTRFENIGLGGNEDESDEPTANLRRRRSRHPRAVALAQWAGLPQMRCCERSLQAHTETGQHDPKRRVEVRRLPQAIHRHGRHDLRGFQDPTGEVGDGHTSALREQEGHERTSTPPDARDYLQIGVVHG